MASHCVLTDLHWLREITSFQDGLPGLIRDFQVQQQARSTPTGAVVIQRTDLVRTAIAAQDLRVLTTLERLAVEPQPPDGNVITFDNAFEIAASGGHLVALQWLLSRRPRAEPPAQLLDAVVRGSGDVATAAWLVTFGPGASSQELTPAALATAASNGHLAVIQWLHETNRFATAFQPATMDSAAASGHLDVVTFLSTYRHEGCTARACIDAAQRGHLAVLECLFQWYPHHFAATPLILDAAALGSGNGHECERLAIVRFLHETAQAPATVAAVDNAAASGDLPVVTYLLTHRREGFSSSALVSAARAGRLDILRLLLQHLETETDTRTEEIDLTRAITAAAQPGHVEIVQLLMNVTKGRAPRNVSGALRVAAAWGHVEIVRLLVAKGEWISLLDAFSQASYHGHDEIVELLKTAIQTRQAQGPPAY